MKLETIKFQDTDKNSWDNLIKQIQGVSYYHSWHWLNYLSKTANVKEHASFILLKDGFPVGICPLAVSYEEEKKIFSISFSGTPCGVPVVIDFPVSLHREYLDYIFDAVKSYINKYNVKQINFIWHPLNISLFSESNNLYDYNAFELLRYNMNYYVENTLVIDLRLAGCFLESNVSRYHLRHIRRGIKKDIKIKVFNREQSDSTDLKYFYEKFQQAHIIAAGRITRPKEAWDAMFDYLNNGLATLFVAFFETTPISYLLCGEYEAMAFGCMQVNVKEFEKKYSPRHLLEWRAILYYKYQKKLKYYELGERYFGPQFFHIPTDKELSISIFKERYGGIMLPKIKWIGFCDKGTMDANMEKYFREFSNKANFFNI